MSGSAKPSDLHVPVHPVRFVTAAALFDGHDAAINIMRRILQAQGAEVIHLGHDRSVREVVDAVLEEDAQGVAISSYQGGHVEYFEYLARLLEQSGAGHVRVFGGGGGVIVADEITRLAKAGVRIFSPEDGQRLGLPGMINELIRECDVDLAAEPPPLEAVLAGDRRVLARAIPASKPAACPNPTRPRWPPRPPPAPSRCSASPAPAAPASPRSPTNWSAGSASTSRTSCGSRCWPWTRPGGAAAAPCSGTGSG